MKPSLSLIVCFLVGAILLFYRFSYPQNDKELVVTTWDAFGYYMYLPGIIIYDDITELNWLEAQDQAYNLTGGQLYQVRKHENGNYVCKYLGGVALLQTPFFLLGHSIAKASNYKADGFSPPYQYSLAFGIVFYCFLALLLLRKVMLWFFDDTTVALAILLVTLATNFIQYVSVDSAQSHAYIFPLYVLVLFFTVKWHETPKLKYAAAAGLVIGLSTICRPTEAIMVLIPALWNTHTKTARKAKWALVKQHRPHLIAAIICGFLGVLPQLIYWKTVTGSFVFNVGSKWNFHNPWFRVLFGFTKGWFIYTPITIFFVAGFFFLRDYPFKKSILIFCLLNFWIIMAWSDWQYGASYSTRALVQSYPVLALAFAAFIAKIRTTKWKGAFYAAGAYLILVNIFQIGQYNDGILHHRDMNRTYYSQIYLNSHPTAGQMSLLDTDEFVADVTDYKLEILDFSESEKNGKGYGNSTQFHSIVVEPSQAAYLQLKANLKTREGFGYSFIDCKLSSEEFEKTTRVRIFSPLAKENQANNYEFFMALPDHTKPFKLEFGVYSDFGYDADLNALLITALSEK